MLKKVFYLAVLAAALILTACGTFEVEGSLEPVDNSGSETGDDASHKERPDAGIGEEANNSDEAVEEVEEAAEAGEEAEGIEAVSWYGYVVSLGEGAQYDDYVVLLPEGTGEFGIDSMNEAVAAEIVALRDKEQPGKVAHFTGTLVCDVPDYGGCQFMVTDIRTGIEILEGIAVDGWRGTLVSFSYDEPGAPQPDNAFVLEGPVPMQYGIDSMVEGASGEFALREVINSLNDSGDVVTVYGQMMCGVPDANGCQMQVTRIEAAGEVYEITP